MPPHDELSDRSADLIRAAEAVASWARARRATWASEPARPAARSKVKTPAKTPAAAAPPAEIFAKTDVPADVAPKTPPPVFEPPAPPRYEPIAAPPYDPVVSSPDATEPSAFTRISESARTYGPLVVPWLPHAGVAAAVLLAAFIGIPYLFKKSPTAEPQKPAPVAAPAVPAGSTPPGRASAGRGQVGRLHVTSTPGGARVLIDGKPRGVTPLTLADVSVGHHEVALESNAGTVHRTVTVAANQTAEIDESIFSGWLMAIAPFEIVVAEGDRVLRPDERGQILLPPGIHQLRVMNKQLAYEATWSVEIKPGEITNLRLTPNPSTLTVTASDAAEVFVDGTKVGTTPLNAAPVPLGSHEVVVKRLSGGEKRFTVTVGVSPVTLNADFK